MSGHAALADMIDDMGIFHTTIEVAPLGDHTRRVVIDDVMVDTGSEYNWIPSRTLADLGIVPIRMVRMASRD